MRCITYKRATADDAATLSTLRAAFLAEVRGVDPADPALLAALQKYFAATLPSGEFVAYLAEGDGLIVATSGLVFHRHPPSPGNLEGRDGYVMNMYTLPQWRGRGIAAELLQRLLAYCREVQCRRITLHALPLATAIYARAGFEPIAGEMRLVL